MCDRRGGQRGNRSSGTGRTLHEREARLQQRRASARKCRWDRVRCDPRTGLARGVAARGGSGATAACDAATMERDDVPAGGAPKVVARDDGAATDEAEAELSLLRLGR